MTTDAPRIRLRIIGVVAFSLFVALLSRLWFLQIMNADAYTQRAAANVERVVPVSAPRGRIFDAKGNLLVDNKVITVVSVDKAELERTLPARRKATQRRDMLTRLAIELSKSGRLTKVADIETALKNSPLQIGEVPIALDVDKDLVVYLGERPDEFPGVRISQTTIRDYRYGDVAAHLLGYVGRISDAEYRDKSGSPKTYTRNDQIGKSGIEQMFEDELRGMPGQRVYEVDSRERPIREVTEKNRDPVPGNDIYLTIDIDLQKMIEDQLRTALEQAREQPKRSPTDPPVLAPAGAAVMVDPHDGSVLAMASYPTYDPSEFVLGISQARFAYLNDPANYSPILNRVIQGEYAPGSTFKLFTAYAALDGGFMGKGSLPGVSQRIDDSGTFKLTPCDGGKCSWTNAKDGAGRPLTFQGIDMRGSLPVSSDTYYYAIGAEIAKSKDNDHASQDAARAFGLGLPTGVTLPNERDGRVPDREMRKELHEKNPTAFPYSQWFVGDNINVAVGQGETLVTPLQLANSYATFANGGTIHAPNLVHEVRDNTGKVTRTIEPRVVGQVDIPPEVRQPILDGLLGVTANQRGTAYNAFHNPSVGAAVDLSKFPIAGKTGTAEVKGKADTALFASFGPSTDPRYAMAVVLEQSGFGGANAAPVAAKVLDAALNNRVPHAYSNSELLSCFMMRNAKPSDAGPPSLPSGVPCP
jgi:penicillin-binding protein 2